MKVLFVTAECWPFAKTGGLGDVSYALPKALKKEGVDVRVIMPKYVDIPKYLKDKMKQVSVFNVNVGWRNQYCGLLELELDGIKFYFIDNEYYFAGNNPYNNIYEDVEKFAKGVSIGENEMTKPAVLKILVSDEISEIELTIQEGKFHQVKRMFEAVDKKVIYLKRLSMGTLRLDESLALGEYRKLTKEELEQLC